MIKLAEIIEYLNTVAPSEFAEDYDNVGLLIGDKNKEIKTVLITLDADELVAKDAERRHADLVLSHHPLIFSPLKRITGEDGLSKTVLSLIKNDIALFAMHTNFDSVKSGLNDLFLDKIANTKKHISMEGDGENGLGRVAELEEKVTFGVLLNKIKSEFKLSHLRYIGDENKVITKIAAVNGGGAEYVSCAKKLCADCFISGDFKYHQARYAYENDLALVEIPHYSAEIIFCDYVKDILEQQFGERINIQITDKNIDVWKHLD